MDKKNRRGQQKTALRKRNMTAVTKSEIQRVAKMNHQQYSEELKNLKATMNSIQTSAASYKKVTEQMKGHMVKKKDLDQLVGRKTVNSVIQCLKEDGYNPDKSETKAIEMMILSDDMFSGVKRIARAMPQLAQRALPIVKQLLPQFAGPIEMAQNALQIYTGAQTNNQDHINISRRYQLIPVTSTYSNSYTSIAVNPGLAVFGQWLSTLSQAYTYYKIRKLTFSYEPTSSLLASGQVFYYLDLDPTATNIIASQIPQQYKAQNHSLFAKSQTTYAESELHQLNKHYKLRQGSVDNLEQYDVGTFYFGTTTTDSQVYGNFYVDIDVELFVPQLNSTVVANQSHYQALLNYSLLNLELTGMIKSTGLFRSTAIFGITGQPVYQCLKTGTYSFIIAIQCANVSTPSYPGLYSMISPEGTVVQQTHKMLSSTGVSGSRTVLVVYQVSLLQGVYIICSSASALEAPIGTCYLTCSSDPQLLYTNLAQKQETLQKMLRQYLKQAQNNDEEDSFQQF